LRYVAGFDRGAASDVEASLMIAKKQDYAVADIGLADYGRK
jgi:hypothetical protein